VAKRPAAVGAEGIERVNLVGQSMGGYIAQIVALEHPGRVNSLCALDSSPLDLDYYSGLDKGLLSITPALLKLYPYKTLVRTIAKQISVSDAGRAYALRTLEGLTKGEIASIMAAVYGGLVEYGRENVVLPCPVLLVVGERDETGKVIRYCRAWAEKEGLPLQTVPDAAHNSNVDNPRAFNDILEGFLEGR
jgi:pimeloyl-ACP methyl ester carboxylesterase